MKVLYVFVPGAYDHAVEVPTQPQVGKWLRDLPGRYLPAKEVPILFR